MDATLLQIFATEQSEHIERIRSIVDTLGTVPPEARTSAFDELLRRAHTLKGAARAVGLQSTERLVHRMESVFAGWRESTEAPGPDALSPVHRALDGAEDILAAALGTRSAPDPDALLRLLEPRTEDLAAEPVSRPQPSQAAPPPEPPVPRSSAVGGAEFVRVNTALLDAIVRSASQLVQATHEDMAVARSAAEHAAACAQLAQEYQRQRRHCNRYLQDHAAEPDIESVADTLAFLDGQLASLTAQARNIAAWQEQRSHGMQRLVSEVSGHARHARMIPAEAVFGAYGAMVRELADREGKEIVFRSHGLELQADRDVLQSLKDPVMHVLRNAVSHGIEHPAERVAGGKPPAGSVSLTVEVRDRQFAVCVEDDGRGLDLPALSRMAVQRGILTQAAASAASPEALARLIFVAGLSTSSQVTALSGRGVGLSAVAQTVAALQGDIRVRHRSGGGTAITISVPMSLLTQQVVLLKQGAHAYALPANLIRQLSRFRGADVHVVDGVESIVVESRAVPLVRLSDLLGQTDTKNAETAFPTEHPIHQAVILESGDARLALVVEELLDSRETVVKQTGLAPSEAGWSVGAIALEDGSVAVMLSSDRLLRQFDAAGLARQSTFRPSDADRRRPRVLVVDDSVTTRSMERSLLEANGYEVQVAVDGLEAWNTILGNAPDLVISDVNMPHMDGFQLLERIKTDTSTQGIPVILVTSLDSREEQERGLLLGADAYIVKRKFDHRELLRVVRQIV